MSNYINLHSHTNLSLLDGLSKIEPLVKRAVEIGYKSLAISDHGCMFGVVPFTKACKQYGLKPIIGCENYYTIYDTAYRPESGKLEDASTHLILLAKNEIGYKNLCKLSTISYIDGMYYKPRVGYDVLKKHSEGLIAISACLNGIFNRFLLKDKTHIAYKQAEMMKALFGEDLYCEIQPHPLMEQQKANLLIKKLASDFNLKMVLTLDNHYTNKADYEAHDALLCISTGTKLTDKDRMSYLAGAYHLYSPAEVEAFGLQNDFPGCLENTLEIDSKINFELNLGVKRFPKFPLPDNILPEDFLAKQIEAGFNAKLAIIESNCKLTGRNIQDYKDRIEYEKSVIKKTGFIDYFLIVWDAIKQAKANDVPIGPGRGSVVGSIVAWLLDITQLDPVRFELSFERFLNEHRVAPPDADIDCGHRDHHKIIEYLKNKYGSDRVANIATFSKLAPRAALKDVGRVMDIPFPIMNYITSLVPESGRFKVDFAKAYEMSPELLKKKAEYPELFAMAEALEGTPRHSSVHAAGYVISPEPITEFLPLFVAKDEGGEKLLAVQADMHDVEDMGLLKQDWLRVTVLDCIKDALASIKQHEGIDIDINRISLQDTATYDLLCKAETDGIFQLGSDIMKHLCRQIQPRNINDVSLINALVRPGAEESANAIFRVKKGQIEANYLIPELEPILSNTYGGLVFQEQIIKIAIKVAGLSFTESDLLRKSIGKKSSDLMAEQKDGFINGCLKNGQTKETAEQLFRSIEKSASYSFNESHSLGYALLAYQSAYLKANYPVHYYAALLTQEAGDKDKLSYFIGCAKKAKIKILPPNIDKSSVEFKYEDGAVRYGFCGLYGLGEATFKTLDMIKNGFDEKEVVKYYFHKGRVV